MTSSVNPFYDWILTKKNFFSAKKHPKIEWVKWISYSDIWNIITLYLWVDKIVNVVFSFLSTFCVVLTVLHTEKRKKKNCFLQLNLPFCEGSLCVCVSVCIRLYYKLFVYRFGANARLAKIQCFILKWNLLPSRTLLSNFLY